MMGAKNKSKKKAKKTETVYMVFGYMGTGSGSLTFPEDFDLPEEAYTDKAKAEAKCKELNRESKEEYTGEVSDDDEEDEEEDEEESDRMIYEVYDVKIIRS